MLCVCGSEEPLKENQTIGSLYEATHYKILRLYVCTRQRSRFWSLMSDETDRHLTLKRPQLTSPPDITPSTSGCHNQNRSQTLHSTSSSSMNSNDDILQSSDDEVVFLGNDVNTSSDMVSDTLVYSPVCVNCVVTETFVDTLLETVPSNPDSIFIPGSTFCENTGIEETVQVTENPPQATESQEPTNN